MLIPQIETKISHFENINKQDAKKLISSACIVDLSQKHSLKNN